ncbi:MAG: CCA tRNA nucleotidyltransferase, partial [Thermodesulfobacteriota bacterium]
MQIDTSWLTRYPRELLEAVNKIALDLDLKVYIVGGAVRDGLLSREKARDLDLAVIEGGVDFAEKLALALRGTFVLLDSKEGVARVVWRGYDIDLAGFKDGVDSIEEDLLKRDFTVNAMALRFPSGLWQSVRSSLFDPAAGRVDLEHGIVRTVSGRTFNDDPLRLLRAYRLQATLGFTLDEVTEREIRDKVHLIERVAPERVSYELDLIMSSDRSCQALTGIRDAGLFKYIIPEIERGRGVEQPSGHHLDVMDHNMAALCAMEEIVRDPGKYFQEEKVIQKFLNRQGISSRLKWAAFFHDLGKPDVVQIRDKRITFYNHERFGADQVKVIGARLRWSRDKTFQISRLVGYHMWPFHLSNVRRKEGITTRACLRLVKTLGDDLPGLFMLAIADSLASQGPGRPVHMEKELAELFSEVYDIFKSKVSPALASPGLITGHDLIVLGLAPGPVFKDILR